MATVPIDERTDQSDGDCTTIWEPTARFGTVQVVLSPALYLKLKELNGSK